MEMQDTSKERPRSDQNSKEISSNFAKKILNVMGRPIPGQVNFHFILIILSQILVALQSVIVIIFQWNDFAIRSKAMENLNLTCLSFFTIGELAFFPEKIEILIKITNEPIYEYKFPLSEKQEEIQNEVLEEEKGVKNRFQAIITYYCLAAHLLPFLYSLTMMLLTDNKCCENAHFSYVYWLPFTLDNILMYSFISTVQLVCAVTVSAAYVCWFLLFISSLLQIGKEIDILCLFIEEMDKRLDLNNETNHSILDYPYNENAGRNSANSEMGNEDENKLKKYLKEIIQHHLAILQAVQVTNKTGSRIMFMYNQFCCIELCLNLYLTTVVIDIKRYNYLSTFFIVMTLVGIIGNVGQKLSNKGEKLYKVINECSWINKPNWFKKSIYMMIIQAAKPLQIKPGGLFVLNLENTMKIGQATYSYFNLLRSVK